MVAHSNRDMIVAKADNKELVVFAWSYSSCGTNNLDGKKWYAIHESYFPTDERDGEYFACLPEYQDQCLHWLNGGVVDCRKGVGEQIKLKQPSETLWTNQNVFMVEGSEFKIVSPEIK
ncbi:hypothetical protein OTK49_20840 [Vibrio coralliirubri]|uniref:hypothetical protein n=1 Tax=Vibrio coralliirubri TaxID=1516159 RepID=UPI002283FCC7|nr:hypothetical protein [Vibrio coralliirubri]MCY9864966.1 hypothetical protein [Vibrio coralliirubri]